jgi:glutamyl/glutaminyl-tRNA synthetase
MHVRVRIAPSPTGNLHLGTARTALFNWLFARHHGGEFMLRIEDTDAERSKKEFEADIIEGLRWLGIPWDNERIERQTERLPVYREHLQRLLDSGKAFWKEYSAAERAALEKEGRPARDRVIVLTDDGDPERDIAFDDSIRGRVAVKARFVGPVVIAKSLDEPLYHFAVVVDDMDMRITHVIRGEEHISNTPKQLLIAAALGAPSPQFAHLPLILNPDRSKMSKRFGATSIDEYRRDYLPEALLNFIGLLGCTYSEELLTPEQMAAEFDLPKVHKSGAVFDLAKLNWMNSQYIKRLTPGEFRAVTAMSDLPDAAVPLMTERLERLTDVTGFSYLWQDPAVDASLLPWKDDAPERTRAALEACAAAAREGVLTRERLDALALSDFGGQKGSVYWPLRVALSGLRNSAGPLDIAAVIGPHRTLQRIEQALTSLMT